jgi:flavin-binding protein dodecin
MENSVAKVITVIGSSPESWEKAAAAAVATAAKTVHGIHVADVRKLYMHVEDGKITSYRARIRLAFEYDEKYKDL